MDMNPSHPESQEALLRALVLRLAAPSFDPSVQNPQVFVGQVPAGLPFELPIPSGSRILGGVARSALHITILLDVPLPLEQASAFYKERLQAAGWSEPEQPIGIPDSGFVHSHPQAPSHSMLFCKGPRGPSLYVFALAEQTGITDVQLDLNLDERESLCAESVSMRRQQHLHRLDFEQLLPPLVPPAGARQQGGGGGSSNNESYYSEATLEADGDPAALATHYAGQLTQAGWTQTEAGNDGPLAWHTWTLKDEDGEPWRGFFFILKMPGLENEYHLYIRADLAQKREWRDEFFYNSHTLG